MDELPLSPTALASILNGSRALLSMVRTNEAAPTELVQAFATAIDSLEATAGNTGWIACLKALGATAGPLADEVAKALKGQERELKALQRRALARTVLDERRQKAIGRLRTSLERSVAAELAILGQVREQVRQGRRRKRSAFEEVQRPKEFTLRVVR